MVRSMAARCAVGAFAFTAAATWLGVGVIHGVICLLVAFLGSQVTRLYQRRTKFAGPRRRTAWTCGAAAAAG